MDKNAKEYMNSVVEVIMRKHGMSEVESYKIVKRFFYITH